MVRHVGMPSIGTRATAVLALVTVLAGCGSTVTSSRPNASAPLQGLSAPTSCAATVSDTLARVLKRVYVEGISSERTVIATRVIASATALREAMESGNAPAVRAAAQALVAGGHMTSLRVIRGGHTLAEVGVPAVAPLRGTLIGANGAPIGTYVTSVWSDSGFLAEGTGVAEGLVALRANGRSIGGSFALAPGGLPSEGTLTHGQVLYQYASFPAEVFPSGSLRVYLLRPVSSTAALCGHTNEDTLVNTLRQVANRIYTGEAGPRTVPEIRRMQRNRPLLEAVARRDPTATKVAIDALLTQHVVRLRVSAGNQLLSDVGGPFVLAPVSAELRLGGRTIGSFVLSIQDDEGYKRLAHRLAGLDVLIYMGSQLVKNSLGPEPGTVPASGPYQYHGRYFRVSTINAEAFPSGPLLIRVLIPIPYS